MFLFEMASSANLDNVLKQLTAIFRRLNSGEDALSELQVLKEHCGRVIYGPIGNYVNLLLFVCKCL